MSELEWVAVAEQLPEEGVLVMTKIDNNLGVRNEQPLVRRGQLWWTDDTAEAMYVYYTPTHWKELGQ